MGSGDPLHPFFLTELMMKYYALVDCNNFYVSCERIFNPQLEKRPVVVLSNNDGCVVSRSAEAKALNIAMAVPLFQLTPAQRKAVTIFSSNYPLYGDISNRVMSILSLERASLEVYSIDEAFMLFESNNEELLFSQLLVLQKKIKKWVGVPVTIGLAPTRTLAKLACYQAKKKNMPVLSLCSPPLISSFLAETKVGEIWGIGRKSVEKLMVNGIRTAKDLSLADDLLVQRLLGVIGKRKKLELNAIDALEQDDLDGKKESISSSKSFSHGISKIEDLDSAIISYATRCGEKLRRQESLCHFITVFVTTGNFSEATYYSNSMSVSLDEASDSLRVIIAKSIELTHQLFRQGTIFKKAGVILSGIVDKHLSQPDLFSVAKEKEADDKLMEVMDKIKGRMGRDSLQFGVTKEKGPWKSQANYSSPQFTTNWHDILKVKA